MNRVLTILSAAALGTGALAALPAVAAPAPHSAPAPSSVPAARSVHDCAKKPGDILKLDDWKLTLPTGSDGDPTEIKQPKLNSYTKSPYFVATADCTGVQFRAPVNGTTTSGSSNPRSELREMDGGDEASWSADDGTRTLTIEAAVTKQPKEKPAVVVGQVHNADDDVTVFRFEGSKVYVTDGDNAHYKVAADDYTLGTKVTLKLEAKGGKINMYYNGKKVTSIADDGDGNYFKAGAYTQANCDTSDPCEDSNYGEAVISKLTVDKS